MSGATAELAAELLAAYDEARLMTLPSVQQPGLGLLEAYVVAEHVRQQRQARGERQLGWKIGFTNRTIWARYGVHAPIWGPVWDRTASLLDGPEGQLSVTGLVQPRIEPEVVFGFARAPEAGMDEAALAGCLEWVAHGFEIVHTHCADWRFTAPDTVADFALHGRLFVGPRVQVAGWQTLGADLSAMSMALRRGGTEVDRGLGENVLGGPLSALRIWLGAMAQHSPAWQVSPGDIVTTGTITDAWPVAPGQVWTSEPGDARLVGLRLEVVA